MNKTIKEKVKLSKVPALFVSARLLVKTNSKIINTNVNTKLK